MRCAAVCAAALVTIARCISSAQPASAAACDGRFTSTGIILQKWNAFNGPASALGCPISHQETYKPGFSNGLLPVRPGTQQEFQHGTIVSFPSLGPNALFSAWYNGSASIHVEFTGLSSSFPHFRVGLSPGAVTLTNEHYTDFDGGTGHNRDISLPFSGASFVSVRLLPCEGTPYVCPPRISTQYGIKSEDPADGATVIGITLAASLSTGSLSNNAPPISKLPSGLAGASAGGASQTLPKLPSGLGATTAGGSSQQLPKPPSDLGGTSAGGTSQTLPKPPSGLAGASAGGESAFDKSPIKTFTMKSGTAGDCTAQNLRLSLENNGPTGSGIGTVSATFTTRGKHTDIWHVTMTLTDASGNALFTSPQIDSEPMQAGGAYGFGFNNRFGYPANLLPRIEHVTFKNSC